jgi:hypothetical protein
MLKNYPANCYHFLLFLLKEQSVVLTARLTHASLNVLPLR